jgi:hypothetical protein
MPHSPFSFQPTVVPSSFSSPALGHLGHSHHEVHDHSPTNIHFLDLPSPVHSHAPTIPPPSPSKTHSIPHLASHKGQYHRALAWWNRLPRIEESGYEEDLSYQHDIGSSGSQAEDDQWRRKERRRGLMEVVMLFGVAFILAGIVVVCLRMDGDGEEGDLI